MSKKRDRDFKEAKVPLADHTGIGICQTPGCGCGGVFVQLYRDGRLIAAGSLTPENAIAYGRDLIEAATKQLLGEVSGVRN